MRIWNEEGMLEKYSFLPRVESGDIVLIGATTENPSFEVNAALLSRSNFASPIYRGE